jgi:hypothetical protein
MNTHMLVPSTMGPHTITIRPQRRSLVCLGPPLHLIPNEGLELSRAVYACADNLYSVTTRLHVPSWPSPHAPTSRIHESEPSSARPDCWQAVDSISESPTLKACTFCTPYPHSSCSGIGPLDTWPIWLLQRNLGHKQNAQTCSHICCRKLIVTTPRHLRMSNWMHEGAPFHAVPKMAPLM